MADHQTILSFDTPYAPAPGVPSGLRDEIAAAWGLPLGERVEISLRGDPIDPLTGTLELVSAPDYPWNPREALRLRIAGFVFGSRDIERWTKI